MRDTSDPVERFAPLSDCATRTENGERYIDALAAVFDTPQEIRDRDGHYMEVIDPAAFNRTIEQRGANGFQVMFNHGKTMYGTPSERYSMPYGVPVDVRPDARGLVTTTRMLSTPWLTRSTPAPPKARFGVSPSAGRSCRPPSPRGCAEVCRPTGAPRSPFGSTA